MSLLANVDKWVRGSGREKTAWINGHAGSGKTALLNSIAENLEKAGIPFIYFPCKRDDLELSNIHRIPMTISYRFTEYFGDYHSFVSNLVDQPEGRSILAGDVRSQFKALFGDSSLYEIISPEHARRPPVHVILIDALDECRNHRDEGKTADERRILLDFLLNIANTVPWVKFIVTSRPEPDIVDTFTDTACPIYQININDDGWETSSDIRLFVEAQSAKLKLGLSTDQIDRFQVKASGLFIWCTTVFRFIQESQEKWDTVNDILNDQPSNLDDNPYAPLYFLYQRVLSLAVSRARDKELMELILSTIFVSATRLPLSAAAIADILYPDGKGEGLLRKRMWVDNIVRSLSAIVYVEEKTNFIRTCHPSVLDFVRGMLIGGLPRTTTVPEENMPRRFTITLYEIHSRIFSGCFIIMNRDLRFNICELEDSSRLDKDLPDLPDRITKHIGEALRYGCLFWLAHLELSDVDMDKSANDILAFLSSRKALFWVEALNLMDAVDRSIVILQDCAHFFNVRPFFSDVAH